MGIGPKGSSLLHKLGKKQAWEMEDQELLDLVLLDQHRRSTSRALGRLNAMSEEASDGAPYSDRPRKSMAGRPKTKSTVKHRTTGESRQSGTRLEDFGLLPAVCDKLRSTGKQDFQLILELQAAGLIK